MAQTDTFSERWARRYAAFTGRRPFLTLAVLVPLLALSGWYGAGIAIRSNMEDLFPDDTPAVVAARHARETLKSSSQLVVIFGSPARDKNRALATDFCDRVSKLPEVVSVDCHRDIAFFRRNSALFMSIPELEKIETDVRDAIKRATEKDLAGDELSAGLDEPVAPTDAAPGQKPPENKSKLHVPSEDELRERFQAEDVREWTESPDGQVLGVKVFPTVLPSQIDASAAFMAKVDKILLDLKPTSYHPNMIIDMGGDYADMTAEVSHIQHGLAVTSLIAIFAIIALQFLHFRRWRAIILMFLPLIGGVALTMAIARLGIGYLNLITSFIFGILFGLGDDFGVFTLSRYYEERAAGRRPQQAIENTVGDMWRSLGTAAVTAMAGLLSLTVLHFRGFSQFGLIGGLGVALTLLCMFAMFPPLIMAFHRIRPERDVPAEHAAGSSWMGWFANRRIARMTVYGLGLCAIAGAWAGSDLHFETNLAKLRTPGGTNKESAAETARHNVGYKFRSTAQTGRNESPIVIVADTPEDAHYIHLQLDKNKTHLTRMDRFVSLSTFVPEHQAEKAAIAQRIRQRIAAKLDALEGDDQKEAQRALEFLDPKPYTAQEIPDFVRKRFLDTQGSVGRFLLVFASGNLLDADSVREVVSQLGSFKIPDKDGHPIREVRSTASYFILAEADTMVRKEGPRAVLLAALAILIAVSLHFRNLRMVFYTYTPVVLAFLIFLGVIRALHLQLNLFSVTVLPSILGIAIDGTLQIVHRYREEDVGLQQILAQTGGAAWAALVTTAAGFAALLFQDNPGLQSIAWMAIAGLPVVCTLGNILTGALLAWLPPPASESGRATQDGHRAAHAAAAVIGLTMALVVFAAPALAQPIVPRPISGGAAASGRPQPAAAKPGEVDWRGIETDPAHRKARPSASPVTALVKNAPYRVEVATTDGQKVMITNGYTLERRRVFEAPAIAGVAFSPDGAWLYVVTGTGEIVALAADSAKASSLGRVALHPGEVVVEVVGQGSAETQAVTVLLGEGPAPLVGSCGTWNHPRRASLQRDAAQRALARAEFRDGWPEPGASEHTAAVSPNTRYRVRINGGNLVAAGRFGAGDVQINRSPVPAGASSLQWMRDSEGVIVASARKPAGACRYRLGLRAYRDTEGSGGWSEWTLPESVEVTRGDVREGLSWAPDGMRLVGVDSRGVVLVEPAPRHRGQVALIAPPSTWWPRIRPGVRPLAPPTSAQGSTLRHPELLLEVGDLDAAGKLLAQSREAGPELQRLKQRLERLVEVRERRAQELAPAGAAQTPATDPAPAPPPDPAPAPAPVPTHDPTPPPAAEAVPAP